MRCARYDAKASLPILCGTKTPEEGAIAAVRLATIGQDGATGGFFDESGRVPW